MFLQISVSHTLSPSFLLLILSHFVVSDNHFTRRSLMSVSHEQDYVGLTELPSMEKGFDKFSQRSNNSGLNLKATELRLGQPGSESPERDGAGAGAGKSAVVCGAKRGFSDTINGGSGKWALSGNGGSEAGLGKDGGLFSPRGVSNPSLAKDSIPNSPKPLLHEKKPQISAAPPKEQVVGWPPIRSFRKNTMASSPQRNGEDDAEAKSGCLYVKVSMDGAPYLRKVDLKNFASYRQLSSALEKMFRCFTISQCGSHGISSHDNLSESRLKDLLNGSEYVLTYEDKDGDWMLVGDVPWEMFTASCKRLRIMKSSEAIGLAPRAMEKCKSRN